MNAPDYSSRPAPADTLLSIVLPVYNEAQVLGNLLDSLLVAATQCGTAYEVIFVNDGSHDDSPRILDRLAAENPWVRVVHLSRNFGHQAAVQAGLAHARGHCVVLMDSDLQDAPTALPQFVHEWQAGYDVVYAVRVDRKENWLKRFAFASFYRLLSAVSTTSMPLDAGNFGLIDRRVARHIVALGETDRYYAGLRSWVGFRQKGIPVQRSSRYDDSPRVSFWGLCRLARTAIFSFSRVPLSAFYIVSVLAAAVFALALIHATWTGAFTSLASTLTLGSSLLALNSLGIAILGEYIVRIYDQVRARPIYVVDRQVNFDSPRQIQDQHAAYRAAAALIDEAESTALNCLADSYAAHSQTSTEEASYLDLLAKVSSLLEASAGAGVSSDTEPSRVVSS